jgi:DNA-binding response OmpR family regulator
MGAEDVRLAGDPEEALQMLLTFQPKVAILDFNLGRSLPKQSQNSSRRWGYRSFS